MIFPDLVGSFALRLTQGGVFGELGEYPKIARLVTPPDRTSDAGWRGLDEGRGKVAIRNHFGSRLKLFGLCGILNDRVCAQAMGKCIKHKHARTPEEEIRRARKIREKRVRFIVTALLSDRFILQRPRALSDTHVREAVAFLRESVEAAETTREAAESKAQ